MITRSYRRLGRMAAVGAAALLALGPGAGTARAAEPVRVGVVMPLTGPFAEGGTNVRRGYEMAIEEVNAAGGIKSLGGAKIELVFGDHQGKQDLAIGEVERLAQREKVAMLAGTWQSGPTVAATQAAERQRTPFVVEIASADPITDRGLKYTVRINLKGSWNGTAAVGFIDYLNKTSNANIKNIAILAEDSDFGQATARGVKAAVAAKGLAIVSEQAYSSTAQDVTAQISKVKSANADMMITISQISDAVLVAKTAERIGLKIPKLGVSGGYTAPTFLANAGKAADGWLVIDYFNKDLPGKAKELNDKFRAKYGQDMKGFSALGYQGGIVVAEALEKAGRETGTPSTGRCTRWTSSRARS